MEARGLCAALIHKPQNMRYLTGFTGEGCLFVSAQRQAVLTDFRYVEQLSRQAPALECVRTRMGKSVETLAAELAADAGARTLAVETDFLCYDDWAALQAALGDVSLTPLAGLVEEMRLVKDEGEIDCIRRAADIACRAFKALLEVIRPGMTEREVAIALNYEMLKLGSEGEAFEPSPARASTVLSPRRARRTPPAKRRAFDAGLWRDVQGLPLGHDAHGGRRQGGRGLESPLPDRARGARDGA